MKRIFLLFVLILLFLNACTNTPPETEKKLLGEACRTTDECKQELPGVSCVKGICEPSEVPKVGSPAEPLTACKTADECKQLPGTTCFSGTCQYVAA